MSHAVLSIWVTRPASTSLYLAAGKPGLEPRCTVTGVTSSEQDPRFDRVAVRLEIVCGTDHRLSAYAEMHGVETACGRVEFSKDLKPPELHDPDFGTRTFAPISAWVGVDLEQFRLLEGPLGALGLRDGVR